jgi:hypothetical protein
MIILNKIKRLIYNIKRGIKNCIRWIPVIWKDEDWDWEFLALIMEKKLRWMSKDAETWIIEDRERYSRQMLICSEILKRLREDRYDDVEHMPKFFTLHETRKKEWQMLLGKLIGKYLRHWWE